MDIIQANTPTYLISLAWRMTNGKYIFKDGAELVHILNEYDKENKGILFIKEFDSQKNKFKAISKGLLLSRFSWQTEAFLYLQEHYYFKKK